MTFIATLVISATKFTLVGSFSDLSSWRISPVVEALIPTARRRQHLVFFSDVFQSVLGRLSRPRNALLSSQSQSPYPFSPSLAVGVWRDLGGGRSDDESFFVKATCWRYKCVSFRSWMTETSFFGGPGGAEKSVSLRALEQHPTPALQIPKKSLAAGELTENEITRRAT